MPKPRRPKHASTAWRSLEPQIGHDAWQRQADAAAWSAVSGMPPSLYLGALEPIPIPPDLRAKMRKAGEALAAEPSAARADALLRLAHEAVYGAPPPGARASATKASEDEWWT